MPRRTYDPSNGRRRPPGTGGAALVSLQREMERRRPEPSLPATAVTDFQHRPGCRGSSVTAFQGSRGDLMARCHSCSALQVVQEAM